MGDGEAAMCSYAVLNLHMTPSQFINLPPKDKAFIIASIEIKVEQEKKRRKK